MSNTFFSGDIHLGHANIIDLCKRPFRNLYEMEETIIANQRAVVQPNDDYWHMGDLGYKCSAQYLVERLRRLSGRIHIIFGNHDKPLRQAINNGMLDDMFKSGRLSIVGSTDPNIISSYQLNLNGITMILGHYSYRSWPRAFRGAIHLFGHSHNNLPSYFRSFDVGVDANNFKPFSAQEIIDKASAVTKEFREKDTDHSPTTN